jgi:RNA polymerase sigma factor FliA
MPRISPRIRQPRFPDRRSSRELSLWRRFRRTGNPTLREQLVLSYTPLVAGIANRVHQRLPPHLDRQDLVSSGMIGLLAAIDGYDPERSSTFAAYAAPRILGAIIDWLRKNDFIPRSARSRGEDLQFLSLEEPVRTTGADQEQRPSLRETIVDEQARDPQESVVNQEAVRTALDALPPREREIVVLHHFADVPLTTLAELIDVTPRRVSAIHSQAITHLQLLLSDAPDVGVDGDHRLSVADGDGIPSELPAANVEAALNGAPDALTAPELDVLRAAAGGMSAEETAERLTKSPGTVRAQRKSVRAKLRARNMAQAVWLACKKGYLRPGGLNPR